MVLKRLKILEDSQNATVDTSLRELRVLIKAPTFSKDQALDSLLNIRMVARESNHTKAGFYEAVLRAMKEKIRVPDDQFKRYLEVLLGDKDCERVLEMMSKVDKSMRSSSPDPARSTWRGRGGRTFRFVQCFNCHQFGHFQRACSMRRQSPGEFLEPPHKKRQILVRKLIRINRSIKFGTLEHLFRFLDKFSCQCVVFLN